MLTAADRAEITELCHRYAVLIDTRELAEVGALFADDAELVLPEPPAQLAGTKRVVGRDEIEQTLRAVENLSATAHAVLAVAVNDGLIDPSARTQAERGEAAVGLVTGQAHHLVAAPDGYTNTVWFLRYRDAYRVVDGHWRFARRQLDISWIERRPVLMPRIDAAVAASMGEAS